MKKAKPVLQVVTIPRVNGKKKTNPDLIGANGHANLDKNSRTFETRFIPRYKVMPEIPSVLPQPTFSESSNKILKERYLIKGGNLEVVETISERFWHIAYDIASGDFDFNAKEKQVYQQAFEFYSMMVNQEFLPNSPNRWRDWFCFLKTSGSRFQSCNHWWGSIRACFFFESF